MDTRQAMMMAIKRLTSTTKKRQKKPPTSLARFHRVPPSVAEILLLEDADVDASHGDVDTRVVEIETQDLVVGVRLERPQQL